MSAARVIPFPVRASSRHEISGPRAGLATRPEEREPSPGSAWPWITFTGAAGVRMDLELGDFEEPSGRDKEAAERLKASLEATCDYTRWLRLDAWTLQQAACIISGIDPDKALGTMNCFLSKYSRADTPGRFEVFRACAMFAESLKPMLQEMRGSHFAGKLKIFGPWLDDLTMVDPSEVIRWAKVKGYDIPVELEHQAEGVDCGERDSAAVPGQSLSKRPLPEDEPADFIRRLKSKNVNPDEIKFLTYEHQPERWGLSQWQVHCLVKEIPYPPEGTRGEADRDKYAKAYGRSVKRHMARVETSEKSEKVPE